MTNRYNTHCYMYFLLCTLLLCHNKMKNIAKLNDDYLASRL